MKASRSLSKKIWGRGAISLTCLLYTSANDGDYIYYDKAEDAFAQKDARLYGTVIYPGAKFKGKEVIFQAGRKYLENGAWKTETSTCGTTDEAGNTITALNGPVENSDNNINKSGFNCLLYTSRCV